MQQTTPSPQSIRFSGRSFMAFVLMPIPPVSEWLAGFDEFAARSPGFFVGRPVVVDISQMPPTRPDLVHLVTELRRRNITIMGLDGRTPGELGADARGLPPILSGGKDISSLMRGLEPQDVKAAEAVDEPGTETEAGESAPDTTPAKTDAAAAEAAKASADDTDPTSANGSPDAPATPAEAADDVTKAALAAIEAAMVEPEPKNLIVHEPVRSGQSIIHLNGDVIVIGSVASGSEVVAGGSIHVYGALRGRAIAGSNGDCEARVFAQALHAELVAIGGLYKTAEDLNRECIGKPVQAWLEGDALKLAPFNGKG